MSISDFIVELPPVDGFIYMELSFISRYSCWAGTVSESRHSGPLGRRGRIPGQNRWTTDQPVPTKNPIRGRQTRGRRVARATGVSIEAAKAFGWQGLGQARSVLGSLAGTVRRRWTGRCLKRSDKRSRARQLHLSLPKMQSGVDRRGAAE